MGCKAGDIVVNCIGEEGRNLAASHVENPTITMRPLPVSRSANTKTAAAIQKPYRIA
jgi:hypothetical protein